MQKVQALALAFAFIFISVAGCLESDDDKEVNRAPIASIMSPLTNQLVIVGEPFRIDGSPSSDPDGDELSFFWTLSGLGNPIDLSTEESDFVTIDSPGVDLILTLVVKDPYGLTDSRIAVLQAELPNRPPVAGILTPTNGGEYSEAKDLIFDATASSDPDGDILVEYKWELGEAGNSKYVIKKGSPNSNSGDGTPLKFSRTLSEGDYSVTLTVYDPDGEENSVTHSFKITNLPPVAIIVADKTSVFAEESIQFSGDESYDPEGDALDYLWDFGDGQTSSLKSPQHSWAEPGNYVVSLTVEDGNGQEGKETKNIEIKALGPTAAFVFKEGGSEIEKVRAGSNVTLDASDSTGRDVEIKEYKWDFGDGTTSSANESSLDYSWTSGGFYNITLTVIDESDQSGEITKILKVIPEDYLEEGQGNEVVDGVEDSVSYEMELEIFVESVDIEFTDISCVGGFGSQLDYSITFLNAEGTSMADGSGSIACGGESQSWSESFSSEEDELALGVYQATIEFTNGGTFVQANWNYRFSIIYEF